jgi:starvation-inducible DNA-binding protein
MNSPATSTYLPPLEVNHEREGVGEELQATLHELTDLSLIGKQLHGAVVGPLFRPLHLQLDELVDTWRELSDTVAVSQDVLIEVVRKLEEQQWMLRAQLGENV